MKTLILLLFFLLIISVTIGKEVGYECPQPKYCKYISSLTGDVVHRCGCKTCDKVIDQDGEKQILLSEVGVRFCDTN